MDHSLGISPLHGYQLEGSTHAKDNMARLLNSLHHDRTFLSSLISVASRRGVSSSKKLGMQLVGGGGGRLQVKSVQKLSKDSGFGIYQIFRRQLMLLLTANFCVTY